jgi:hypothetical protein
MPSEKEDQYLLDICRVSVKTYSHAERIITPDSFSLDECGRAFPLFYCDDMMAILIVIL